MMETTETPKATSEGTKATPGKSAIGSKATLHDVAAKVGVSPRTVSRVVNDESGFSEKTREAVLEAIAELGYRPNLIARSLVTSRSNTVALIVTVIDDPFFPELANGVQVAARNKGLTMYLAVTEDQADLEQELLSRMVSQAIDGAILFPSSNLTSDALYRAAQGLPIVTIDTEFDHPTICCVQSDLEGGVGLAVEHLRSTGRNHLAMLTNGMVPDERRRRERTFRSLIGEDAIVIESDATYDGGRRAMLEAIERHPEVDGIFAYNDVMAIGAIAAAQSVGKDVPGDLAVIGCDDIEMGARVTPGLTTIRLDRERLGSEAMDRLVELTETGVRPDAVTVPVSLVVRQSA